MAGVITPPAKTRRSHWTADNIPAGQAAAPATEWLETAEELPGSWWPDWAQWLEAHAGATRKAPTRLGDARHKPIEDAPGSYVRERAL